MVHVEIKAEELFSIGPLIVTNSMVGAVLASVVLLLIARWFTRRSGIVPSRGQSAIELPIEFLAGVVHGTGGKRWRQFAPLILGIFLFVLTAPVALAHDGGEGLYGETNDKVVTNAGFIIIAAFPLLIFVFSMIMRVLDKRKDARKKAAKARRARADLRGGW